MVRKRAAYYAAPRILVVKTGAGPVAAVCEGTWPVLQSIYLGHLAVDLDPYGVVGVVNSAL